MRPGLIVGIAGTQLDRRERQWLAHPAVVGVILFARNFECADQLGRLTAELREFAEPRLLVCVDQEGGRVQRFRDGFTQLPAPGVIGRWYQQHPERALDLAYRHGRVMAAELLEYGVDLSLAPVLDLDRGSRVIGDRAFGGDPDCVIALTRHFIAGMRDAGMRSCGKHFPGHGSVAGDTHDEDVEDSRSMAALEPDLAPFRALSDELDAIMPAHVRYPKIDARPAGFSATWIEQVLRRDLGFRGVVVSDDLDMAGAGDALDPFDRLSAAGTAGCDLALVCNPRSVPGLLARLDGDQLGYDAARRAAGALYGRASFTLAEQELVPEFRGWKQSLNKLAQSRPATRRDMGGTSRE